jgi:hypothetical protein
MKTNALSAMLLLLAPPLLAADSSPKDEITAAAKKLGEKPNYSWKTTVVVPEGSQFRPGPTEGQTEKDGLIHVTMTFGENSTQAFIKGEKAAVSDPDGGWQSLSDLDDAEGRRRFLSFMIRNVKTPAAQAADLAAGAKEIKKDGDTLSGELTEDGAKALLQFRARPGGDGPTISNAKGSVKFWLKDGALTKYEFKVKGTRSFNGNEMEIDRVTTVEIKDIGTTQITVPAEAKKKMS